MESPDRSAQESLIEEINVHLLTPEDLDGELYKLSVWHFLYVAVGSCLVLGCGVVAPIFALFDMGFISALLIICLMWWVLYPGAFVNTREAIAEHIVYSWCAKQGIGRWRWIRQRDALMGKMTPRLRWWAQYVDAPQKHK